MATPYGCKPGSKRGWWKPIKGPDHNKILKVQQQNVALQEQNLSLQSQIDELAAQVRVLTAGKKGGRKT